MIVESRLYRGLWVGGGKEGKFGRGLVIGFFGFSWVDFQLAVTHDDEKFS
jgi:hypothetical protein